MRIFWRVASLFWRYWRRAIVAYVCLLVGTALALAIPRLTGQAIDNALSSAQTRTLIVVAAAIGAVGLLRSVCSYYQTYLSEYLSSKVAYDLRNRFYNHLQRLSFGFHDRSQTGQLMSRATSDIENLRMFVGFTLLRGVYFVLEMVVIAVLLFMLDWKLALLSLSVLPVISAQTVVINQRLREVWAKIQQGLGVVGTTLQQNLSGARVVRAFAREDYEAEKFCGQAETIYNLEIHANNLLANNSPTMSFALMLATGGILWYGGRQVISGGLTYGELAQFLLYLAMLSGPVRMLGWLSILFSRANASGKRVFEVLDQTSPVQEKPDAIDLIQVQGRVSFENVSFSYRAQSEILHDVTFEVQPGQIIALVGASGSGKSTIANLIPRFYDVTTGCITIDGKDTRDLTLSSLRRNVGIVHQDTFLFSASIRDNIAYGKPGATSEEITAAARTARLHEFIISLPQGYDTWVGERGITLSGGQKQRLAIARTLLLDPSILIMDDSTSSVDTETEYLIQQALAELPVGRTTFVIAHRLRSVQMADLILVMQEGCVAERGTHQQLMAVNSLYRQLYGLQFQLQERSNPLPQVLAEPIAAESSGDGHEGEGDARHRPSSLAGSDDIEYGKPYDSRVVRRLVPYFTPYKVALPLTIISTILFTFSIVTAPYLVGAAEDNYIATGNLAGLNGIVLLFLANALLNWGAYHIQIRAEAKLGQSILLTLRNRLFRHLQRLPIRFFDANEVGRIMSRVQNDVGELGDFLDSGAFWVAGEVISLIAIIVVMMTMNLKLALLSLSVVPFLFLFIALWQNKARQSFIHVRQAMAAVNSALEETISGVRVIQSLSREEINSQHFNQVNQKHFDTNIRATVVSAIMMPAVELLVSIATALAILYGGLGVLRGTILVGVLVAFILYIQRFFDPIRTLTMEYGQLQRAMASGARVFELLDVPPEVPEAAKTIRPSRLKGDITFENVSFRYEVGGEVLHSINLKIPAGKTVALVGPTGAGKSTIISLIARFYNVTEGRILVDGIDLREVEVTAYRQQLGLVLQDPFLFSGTVKENIRYGSLKATDAEIEAAARAVGAHDFIAKLENGYDTELQERGQNLSMGQRQLLSFVRALLANPTILLLDEATASLDSHSEHLLQESLKRLRQGRTTVIIAHRLSTIREADRIVVLERGRIVEEGVHDDLLARNGLYARLYTMTYAALPAVVRVTGTAV